MSKLRTVEYLKEQNQLWNEFITNSKNGNFLFYREYMEYHSERFIDRSLMFYKGNNLVAVMPANIKDKTLIYPSVLVCSSILVELQSIIIFKIGSGYITSRRISYQAFQDSNLIDTKKRKGKIFKK